MPIDKRRFTFEAVDGKVDLYLDGKKVVNCHRGETGNFYFRIPADVEVYFAVAEHDSNIPIEAEVTEDGLKPVERRPKFVKEGTEKKQLENELKAEKEALDRIKIDAAIAASKEKQEKKTE